MSINTNIRDLKNGADTTSDTLLQIKDASDTLSGVRNIVNQANEKINQTSQTISNLRQMGEEKVEQAQKTADSIKKAGEAIGEVQANISTLTTLSGSATLSGQTSVSGSNR